MNSTSPNPNETPAVSFGFDGPVAGRNGDHLNRWPLAREIYGIATTGPKSWSVRVGIYGEWGTGKTSVLKFIGSMAEQAGHIVIWFNPWEHSTKDALWRAFVLSIYADPRHANIAGAHKARIKGWFSRILGRSKVVESGTAILNEKVSKGVGAGLELLKSCISFSQMDLQSLRDVLGEKRVIVLIDDLDRTAPELVPEILFALKALMDIPGFSFICAFDPMVVGAVLGRYHPGFGDGLKFLDKIIDYPRWLPPASTAGLVNLALADAKVFCAYVPEQAIRDAIPLLPSNPRAVRQFIRLLALLMPQIERHHPYELNWPIIIAADILKIRHPRIAHELLNAPTLWGNIRISGLTSRGLEGEEKLNAAVSEHIHRACANVGLTPEQLGDQKEIKDLLKSICSHLSLFSDSDMKDVTYQVNVAEAPAAVTLKEFDAFMRVWETKQLTDTINTWIGHHACKVERSELDVYRELLNVAIRRYAQVLQEADAVFAESDKPDLIRQAALLLALLKSLVFDLGQIKETTSHIGAAELELLVEKWRYFAGETLAVHADFWPRNEEFILDLFAQWSPDAMPLIRILTPYAGMHPQYFNTQARRELYNKLCAVALPKFARQVLANFRETGFIERLRVGAEDTFEANGMIWDADGRLWGQLRLEIFQVLSEAPRNRVIQANAYELLHWFVLMREGHVPVPGNQNHVERLLSDQAVFDAVWNAAIATPLAPRAVYHLGELLEILKPLGIKCNPPLWWQQIRTTPDVPAPAAPSTNATEQASQTEDPS